MRKYLMLLIVAAGFASCTTTGSLYNWNDYVDASYKYYKKQTPEATEHLMKTYEAMINKPNGSRRVIAPGICGEYGYFLLQNGKKEQGIAMLQKEKELYPESAVFMDRLINQFSK
ncbi:DUF4810 domain-containing protein [uncultured Bacteroides sp.]|uniref:DUF4810 domain-containing protein n=1 Tax=uncultured Bacteroides sp. TaxID=162156 RepID=UPI002AA7314B|nr:DUF4810 domain-containing protein [uncultured Bacteroides sp.]